MLSLVFISDVAFGLAIWSRQLHSTQDIIRCLNGIPVQDKRSKNLQAPFFFTLAYPIIAGVVGAPQMTSQPVSSIFLYSPLSSRTLQTPGLSIPWCCLPTSSSDEQEARSLQLQGLPKQKLLKFLVASKIPCSGFQLFAPWSLIVSHSTVPVTVFLGGTPQASSTTHTREYTSSIKYHSYYHQGLWAVQR